MRTWNAVVLVLSLCALSPATPALSATASAPARDGWPATRAGELARGWVSAFSTGEDAMREFLEQYLAPKALAERNTRARVEKYRTLRDKYGKLQLDAVVKSTPGEITVRLLDSDAKAREFVFTVQTESPYKLVSVAIRERGHGMFGGFRH